MLQEQDFFTEIIKDEAGNEVARQEPAAKEAAPEPVNPITDIMAAAEVSLVIDEKTEEEIKADAAPIVSAANALTIINAPDQAHAAQILKDIKGNIKAAKLKLDPICKASYEAYKANNALKKDLIGPYEEAEKIIKEKIAVFITAEEEKAAKKQAELDAAARHAEEKKRQELEERAEKWAAKGNEEKAELLRDEAETATITPEIAEKQTAKTSGVSVKELWTFEVTDVTQIPKEYMLVNEKALAALAKTTKGAVAIPGVKFFTKKSLAVRAD